MPKWREWKQLPIHDLLLRLVRVEAHEIAALLWAFSYFFVLLCSYYILRPLRDEMGIAGGVDQLQWLFTGTFFAMLAAVPLFGWVSSRFARKTFLPVVYLFFICNLLLFYILFQSDITRVWIARAFFIWTSVFNLFIVSVFWSFMTDIFSDNQSKRLFGFIAAGGTAGALLGPALTAALAVPLGPINLLLISAAGLGWAIICIRKLGFWSDSALPAANSRESESPGLGGGIFEGLALIGRSPYLLGICLVILLYTTLATFLYFQQAQIISSHFDEPAWRTTIFAAMDFTTNALTLLVQVFFTGRIVKFIGLGWALALIPLALTGGFLALGTAPLVTTLFIVQVARRAGNYAIMKPAREMLFVVLSKVEKYKAKNIIDTVIYRSGDAISAWAYTGLQALGLSISVIAFLAIPLTGIWAAISYHLGKAQERKAQTMEDAT